MKKSKVIGYTFDGGEVGYVDKTAYTYIKNLENKLYDMEHEKRKLEWELRSIKPVLETPGLKPAVSTQCRNCRFGVRSSYNGDVIGCNINCVCGDFSPKEEE